MDSRRSPLDPRSDQPPGIRAPQQSGKAVSKATRIAGKRIGGALRAEQARQQKRRDSKRG